MTLVPLLDHEVLEGRNDGFIFPSNTFIMNSVSHSLNKSTVRRRLCSLQGHNVKTLVPALVTSGAAGQTGTYIGNGYAGVRCWYRGVCTMQWERREVLTPDKTHK